MRRPREPDSIPIADVPKVLDTAPQESVYPEWSFCKAHGVWFSFGCPRCKGDTFGCGDTL